MEVPLWEQLLWPAGDPQSDWVAPAIFDVAARWMFLQRPGRRWTQILGSTLDDLDGLVLYTYSSMIICANTLATQSNSVKCPFYNIKALSFPLQDEVSVTADSQQLLEEFVPRWNI